MGGGEATTKPTIAAKCKENAIIYKLQGYYRFIELVEGERVVNAEIQNQ